MKARDLLRYGVMLLVMLVIDVGFYAAFSFPMSPDADIALPALFTVLFAIRERDHD